MDLYEQLQANLKAHSKRHLPNHKFSQVYHYALFPPGKLFRPLLATYVAIDLATEEKILEELTNENAPLTLACSALEVHHTYTLIHDDLPCMDDDDFRRGRPATHKKFGQWQALLAGDGLQALSYRLLALIHHPNAHEVLKVATWALGTKGLIQGQALDLSCSHDKVLKDITLIHKLKTARLIQLAAIVGSYFSSSSKKTFKDLKEALRLGEALGLSFQYLDDLIDIYEDQQEHEKEINPWLSNFQETQEITLRHIEQSYYYLEKLGLEKTSHFISEYMKNCLKKFKQLCPEKEQVQYTAIIQKLERIN